MMKYALAILYDRSISLPCFLVTDIVLHGSLLALLEKRSFVVREYVYAEYNNSMMGIVQLNAKYDSL